MSTFDSSQAVMETVSRLGSHHISPILKCHVHTNVLSAIEPVVKTALKRVVRAPHKIILDCCKILLSLTDYQQFVKYDSRIFTVITEKDSTL